jgi:hypothetical protein
MSGFRLEAGYGPNKARYNYTCQTTNKPLTQAQRLETPWNDVGGWNMVYLDRHNVKCPDGAGMHGYHMRASGDKASYEYWCHPDMVTSKCTQKQTPFNAETPDFNYLDRHGVQCDPGKALNQFNLQRDWRGQFSINYTCCDLKQ